MITVEDKYLSQVNEMSIIERVRRAEAMFRWSRDFLARSLIEASPELSESDLKWEIALRQYGADPSFRSLVRECRHRAPR